MKVLVLNMVPLWPGIQSLFDARVRVPRKSKSRIKVLVLDKVPLLPGIQSPLDTHVKNTEKK